MEQAGNQFHVVRSPSFCLDFQADEDLEPLRKDVSVGVGGQLARIEVTDDGADTVPRPRLSDDLDSRGRGLRLVARLSTAWGVRALGGRQLTVWSEFPMVMHAAHLCEATSNALTREIEGRAG
ncbi:hypothetical protein GCM10012289_59770 [Nonomuraea cavernae]|uniref:Uncharacterized protein n=1 Tax=Nonomuraea cavernae TaxID=2045107 RepID=A0A917Z9M2_9ACTN|nr:hypothetical protein GCM10012289_59770 [Nonomuraea cavernae]